MMNLIRKNLLLITGTLVPVLMILFLIVAAKYPFIVVAPPRYNLLFTVNDWNYYDRGVAVQLYVRDGVLKSEYQVIEHTPAGRASPKLFLYDARKGSSREIALVPQQTGKEEKGVWYSFDVPELKGLRLDSSEYAPDGYRLDRDYRSSGGIMPDLFIGSRGSGRVMLVKDGARVPVLDSRERYYGYDARLLGWILEEGDNHE